MGAFAEEMVGTTRSHVSVFMNKLRKLGFIEHNGDLRVLDMVMRENPHLRSREDDARQIGPRASVLLCVQGHLAPDSRFRFARTRFLTGTIAAFVAAFTLLPFASASAPAARAATEASAFS